MYVDLAVTFPLPFRVLFLIGLGVLGWATNLHVLHLSGIDAPRVLGLHPSRLPLSSPDTNHLPNHRSFYAPLYRFFAGYASWCLAFWLVFRAATRSDSVLVDIFRYLPAICILGVVTVLVCPYDVFHKRERDWFLFTAARCLHVTPKSSADFPDVVFADILTSFAKVLGDTWLSLCMLLPGGSLLRLPSQDGWCQWILPSLMSLPYLVRLRQCLLEYRSPLNSSRKPLFNAIKYASSFPVIFLSAAQRIVISDLIETRGSSVMQQGWHGEHPLFRLWLMSVVVNSLFSFWWDLTNDWGLDLLVSKSTLSSGRSHGSTSLVNQKPSSSDVTARRKPSYPYGLRSVLLYPLPVYPMIVFLNFILRMTWSIKLSSHLHTHSEGSVLIFWLEMAEVLRRWIWVFLRVEWEVIRTARDDKAHSLGTYRNGHAMSTDDIAKDETFD